jgi:hypothetical protein
MNLLDHQLDKSRFGGFITVWFLAKKPPVALSFAPAAIVAKSPPDAGCTGNVTPKRNDFAGFAFFLLNRSPLLADS